MSKITFKMAKQKTTETDVSTEEKIKEAARKVFTQKGFAATRTRDIAEEAGINLALLNYYFRSKEKLFQQIMMEKMQQLFGVLLPILNNHELSLGEKVELIVDNYLKMLAQHPDLPMFVLSELRNPSVEFTHNFPVKQMFQYVHFIQQLKEKKPEINPLHFLINILSMTVFPFIAKPVFTHIGIMQDSDFQSFIQERKKLIPIWIKAILEM